MKYIRYGSQTIDKKDIKAVQNVLKSKYLTSGPLVQLFEKKFSRYVGSKFAIACNSGTAALHLAFTAIGLKKGDKVILPAINFIAAANLCNLIGAKIYFADVDSEFGQITPQTLLDCIKKNKIKKIKMICIMHNSGIPLNVKNFYKMKKKFKCFLIEDCCHSLGGMYSKKKQEYVGNCKYSDLSTFSFHPVKTITTGEGGMVTTNNSNFALKSKLFRNHGIIKKNIKNSNNWSYKIKSIGLNYRMSEIQAALGLSQIKKIDKFIKKRNFIAKIYNSYLNNIDIKKRNNTADIINSYHLYLINIDFEKLRINKNFFIQELHKRKIGVQVHYIPNNLQPLYKKNLNLIGANKYFRNSLSIPIYPNLKIDEVNYVINSIINLKEKYSKN